ncbi:MAG: YybS family protein [Gemmatimonadota bacterium]|nr:YybS family protein [Gemmatimonadota bacterium]
MLALAGYLLLAPPVLLFGPLAGLLLLSRPGTTREWVWLIIAGTWSALWLNQPGGLAGQFARASAVLLTGMFLALTVWRPSARFSRALVASALAAAALLMWMWQLDIGWEDIQRAVEHDLWAHNRELIMRLSEAGSRPGAVGVLGEMSSMVRSIGSFYPALMTIAGLGGLRLAWTWYHRIARHPLGPPPPPFTAFQFNDQLVWAWVVGLGLCLLPLPRVGSFVGGNLLLVWAVLYAIRGLAVFSAGSGRVSGPVIATIALVTMFLLPFVVAGLTLLGLADTWLDFRRRLVPTSAT